MGLSLFFGRAKARRECAEVCPQRGVRFAALASLLFAAFAINDRANAQDALSVVNGAPQVSHVDVVGRVAPRCGFAPGRAPGDGGAVQIELTSTAQINFAVDCNVPFDIRVSAREGGLRRASDAMLSQASYAAGYRDFISYRARLTVDRDQGVPLSAECESASMIAGGACPMAAGRGLHSDFPARSKPANLSIAFESTDPTRLAAGNYSDVITIEVSP